MAGGPAGFVYRRCWVDDAGTSLFFFPTRPPSVKGIRLASWLEIKASIPLAQFSFLFQFLFLAVLCLLPLFFFFFSPPIF